jgi:succinoglycan biosynthesis transport protein ExoP
MFGNRTTPGIEPPQPAVPVTGLPGGQGLGDQPDVHVLDRLHVLYKYRKAMISIIVLVLMAGIAQTYTTTPAFLGTAKVRVQPNSSQINATQTATQMMNPIDPAAFMLTELQVLRSRDLRVAVVRKLRLDQDQTFMAPAGPSGIDGLLDELKGRVMTPIRSVLGSWLPSSNPPAAPAPEPAPAAAKAGEAPPAPRETPEETRAVETLGANLGIESDPTAYIFTINYSASTPERARDIANAVAEVYVAQNLDQNVKNLSDQLSTLKRMVDETYAALVADRRLLLTQTADARVVDPAVIGANMLEAQREATARQYDADAKKITADEMRKFDLENNLDGALTHQEIFRNVQPLRTQITMARNSVQVLQARGFGANHPEVKLAQENLKKAEDELKDEVRRFVDAAQKAWQTAESQRQNAERALRAQQQLAEDNSRNAIPFSQLRERITANERTYQSLLDQQNGLELLAKGVSNNVSIAERAAAPPRPYKPETSKNILMSLAVGLVLAIGLAFGLDYLDDTIKTPEDVTRKLHVPFLGLVPAVRGDRQPVLSGPVPHDFGEAYRALRTSLVFTSGGESTRIITVTSAQPLEGKTTTACNLAMVLSFGGSRVLLIDADMRRPGVHKTLKMNNTVGLSHLLVGQARVREAIQRTSDPNFCVMTAGRTPPNPSELLSSERMKQLIANLKQGPFDWVVIDTPPVLAVTDAVILTPLVDGVTFVLGAEMTRRRLAERAVQMLIASRPRVVGGVLNRVNFDRNKYYYSRYYGYQYKSYYGAEGTNTGTTKA